jgi:hypothetical protein
MRALISFLKIILFLGLFALSCLVIFCLEDYPNKEIIIAGGLVISILLFIESITRTQNIELDQKDDNDPDFTISFDFVKSSQKRIDIWSFAMSTIGYLGLLFMCGSSCLSFLWFLGLVFVLLGLFWIIIEIILNSPED